MACFKRKALIAGAVNTEKSLQHKKYLTSVFEAWIKFDRRNHLIISLFQRRKTGFFSDFSKLNLGISTKKGFEYKIYLEKAHVSIK